MSDYDSPCSEAEKHVADDTQTDPASSLSLTAAQLLLLSKFRQTRCAAEFQRADHWKSALGEAPMQTIHQLASLGLLEQGALRQILVAMFTAAQLKDMLKQHGVYGFGGKDKLAAQLIQVDPEGVAKHAADQLAFQCSEKGRAIVQHYLTQEKAKARAVEQLALQALQQRQFERASKLVASFEASQVFPRGINIDWKNHNHKRDVALLAAIFASWPKILASLKENQLFQLRVAAGMIHLWGTSDADDWLPQDLTTDLVMDNSAAARMLLFYVIHKAELEQYRLLRVKCLEISVTKDDCSCQECALLVNRKYQLENIPELPYEKCTSELGCRCVLLARFA